MRIWVRRAARADLGPLFWSDSPVCSQSAENSWKESTCQSKSTWKLRWDLKTTTWRPAKDHMCLIMSWCRRPWLYKAHKHPSVRSVRRTQLWWLSVFRAWKFIMQNFRKKGSLLVTVPSLHESLDPLQVTLADVSSSYMWTIKSHVVTDAWSLFLSWIKSLLTSRTKPFLVCSSVCLCLCQTGGVAAWLGGGASCQLRRLPGQRRRPRCSPTDPPVQGHLIWTCLSLSSVEVVLANWYSELNWSEVSSLNPNPVN